MSKLFCVLSCFCFAWRCRNRVPNASLWHLAGDFKRGFRFSFRSLCLRNHKYLALKMYVGLSLSFVCLFACFLFDIDLGKKRRESRSLNVKSFLVGKQLFKSAIRDIKSVVNARQIHCFIALYTEYIHLISNIQIYSICTLHQVCIVFSFQTQSWEISSYF